jgi:hypothetical protein
MDSLTVVAVIVALLVGMSVFAIGVVLGALIEAKFHILGGG